MHIKLPRFCSFNLQPQYSDTFIKNSPKNNEDCIRKNQVTFELIKHISFDPRVIIHSLLSAAIYKERSQVFLCESMKPNILAFFGQV
jgi:hypothetical protein